MVRLAIDFEHASRTWWESGGQQLWDGIVEGFDTSEVLMERALAESWLAEAAKVPGWGDGPDYARHPILMKEVEEDELL